MRAVWLNRVATVLAFAGLAIAGYLSLGHVFNASVACGVDRACDVVASHESAYWFGQPVAYYGFAGYLVLAGISVCRSAAGIARTRKLGLAALLASGIGAVASVWLQWQAMTVIKAFCPWCFGSAAVMAALFLVQAMLASAATEKAETSTFDFGLAVVLFLGTAIGLGWQADEMNKPQEPIAIEKGGQLLVADAIKLGPDSAPIKLIEFSDLLCGSCRAQLPKIEELVEQSEGKIQLHFRHFPLYKKVNHEMALPAAFVAEIASEEGKAWEFIHAFIDVDAFEFFRKERVFEVAKSVGLDPVAIEARMKDSDPAFERVFRDIQYAEKAGIKHTPTFVVSVAGEPPRAARGGDIYKLLATPPYKKILDGK